MITSIKDFNLRACNTFRIDAKCDEFIEYSSATDLPAVMDMVGDRKFIHIGAGSNLLFTSDYDGVVLHSRILDVESETGTDGKIIVRAGSGVIFDELIEQCAESGLWGLENLSGIPGEVGAGAVQNVGAYGVEACDAIVSVECYDIKDRRFIELDKVDCDYAYRHSMFKMPENHKRYIITHVKFTLSTKTDPKIEYGSLKSVLSDIGNLTPSDIRHAVMAVRNSKLPSVEETGSAGSFFKNPIVDRPILERIALDMELSADATVNVPHYDLGEKVKIPAAWLIEQCGLKGHEEGNVAVWHKQPLVIVNKTGKATAKEILDLENKIITAVNNRFGIVLTPEVEHL